MERSNAFLSSGSMSSRFMPSTVVGAAAWLVGAAAAGVAAGASPPVAAGAPSCIESISACRSSSSMSSMFIASITAVSEAMGIAAGVGWAAPAAPPAAGAAAAGVAAAAPASGAGAEPPSCCCCRARSSSIEMRSAKASSGSLLASIPNSKPASPPPPPPPPPSPSPLMTDEPSRTSLRSLGPTGTSIRCELSLLFAAAMSLFSLGLLSSTSPKLTTSMDTLFFFKFFPSISSSRSEAVTGLPTKAMIRCFWFLFCRCLRAS
mmetsp:Transcript_60053/g.130256  ORF Transcript_60053/g.130256 Transcript_60053/m.130256 type:complete len:262 (+) Transcript_60053:444-1229(+)